MSRPEVLGLADLLARGLGATVVWATPSARARVAARLPWPAAEPLAPLPPGTATLVVVGGGTLLDEAKAFRARQAPGVRLVAIPSRWGSGAEASPVTVLNRGGKKEITVDVAWLPDVRVVWPELAADLGEVRAREGCADALSHAVEGFLSPLANDDLRAEIAALLAEMLRTPHLDPAWFELSARACAAQARSSVGLVHGIAHALEGPLAEALPRAGLGHARLCATFLWPVLRFDRETMPKVSALFQKHGVDEGALLRAAGGLLDPAAYRAAFPVLEARWRDVLRDACTRTNVALVRPASLEFFRALRLEEAAA